MSLCQSLKEISSAEIDCCKEELECVSSEIWHNPELAHKEYKAHGILTKYLHEKGFAVDRAYTGIPTAFRATFGTGKPNVCVLCEYDALPDIGHACGHNLIAEAGLAGLKAALEKNSDIKGTVTVLGSPAEEESGGKVDLINNGAFKDIDIAMMYHPSPYSVLKPVFVAMAEWIISFTGKAAHTAAFPWNGANALDAAVMAYNSISAFRQQMKPMHSIHGIITKGGTKPNIIPKKSTMHYYIRAPTIKDTEYLMKTCKDCFEAAAQATGCTVEISTYGNVYSDLQSNDVLAGLYATNAHKLGVPMEEELPEVGSTDMGNVSYEVPSIHPMLKIGTGEVYHTRDFTGMCRYMI